MRKVTIANARKQQRLLSEFELAQIAKLRQESHKLYHKAWQFNYKRVDEASLLRVSVGLTRNRSTVALVSRKGASAFYILQRLKNHIKNKRVRPSRIERLFKHMPILRHSSLSAGNAMHDTLSNSERSGTVLYPLDYPHLSRSLSKSKSKS